MNEIKIHSDSCTSNLASFILEKGNLEQVLRYIPRKRIQL